MQLPLTGNWGKFTLKSVNRIFSIRDTRPGGVVGLTYCPVKAEIVGSSPIRVANFRHEKSPWEIPRGFCFGVC